jgi:hypothetical protein
MISVWYGRVGLGWARYCKAPAMVFGGVGSGVVGWGLV